MLQPKPRPYEIHIDANENGDKCEEERNADPERNVGDTEEAIAEAVDEVEEGINVGDVLRELRQIVYGIEDAAEVNQGLQDEGGDEVDSVDRFGVDAVDEAGKAKDERGEDGEEENDREVVDRNAEASEEDADNKHQGTDDNRTDDAAGDESRDDEPRRHRRDEELVDGAVEKFALEKVEGSVGVAVGDDGEHHKTWDHELHVIDSLHRANARAEHGAEDEEVEAGGDDGGEERLHPDAKNTHHVLAEHGIEGGPLLGRSHKIFNFQFSINFQCANEEIVHCCLVLFENLVIETFIAKLIIVN